MYKTVILLFTVAFCLTQATPTNPMAELISKMLMEKLGDDDKPEEEKVIKVIGAEKPEIQWDASSEDPSDSVKAGIVTTLTSKFFEDYNNLVIDVVTANMRGLEIEDFCGEQGVGTLITGHMCMSNQKMLKYNVDKSRSKLEINSSENALKLRVTGIEMDFAFDYNVWSDPEWIKEDGKGSLKIADTDIVLNI